MPFEATGDGRREPWRGTQEIPFTLSRHAQSPPDVGPLLTLLATSGRLATGRVQWLSERRVRALEKVTEPARGRADSPPWIQEATMRH